MTTLNEMPPPWADGPYSIKRHGNSLTQCDAEPVHTPGCIQSHGVLLVLRRSDLSILQISENSQKWLGEPPEHWLGQSAAVLFGESLARKLGTFLDSEPVERNPLFAFGLPAGPGTQALDVVVHTQEGLVLVELEAGQRDGGQLPDCFELLKKTLGRLQVAETVIGLAETVTSEIRDLTGLDRVMIYRFHADLHGEVIAESKREDLAPWLGLHYPAEDIPAPARAIFEQIWIRPLPDVAAPMFEMVPLVNPDTSGPLNMTYCALRGASVMYTEYLQNMGVAASLTMPIRRAGRLWGMIACHHYQPRHLPCQIRAACEFLAQVASFLLASVEDREHYAYRLSIRELHGRLIAQAAQQDELRVLVEATPNLLDGIAAGGVAILQKERWLTSGRTPGEPQLNALAAWLASRPEWRGGFQPPYVTDCLSRDYAPGREFAEVGSGLLAISLSQSCQSLLLWFRPETIQTIDWAGHPDDKPTKLGPNGPRLTPRSSFDLFRESVRLRSLPWKEVEVNAAMELRLDIMQMVVSRAERLAELNAELLRSNSELDTFAYVASHDLKEPLRGISKYAYQLLESAGHLTEDDRKRLEKMAVLTERMDSLLESLLNYSRFGRTQLLMAQTDLNEVVEEALEMVAARREDNRADIEVSRTLPAIACDRIRVREVFCNLISNALKYNDKPRKLIEIGYYEPAEARANRVPVPEACAGQRLYYVSDNGIGIPARYQEQVFKMFKRLHARDEFGGGTGAGLAIVEMLIERHHGRIWLDSSPGRGTTFYFTLSGPATRRLT